MTLAQIKGGAASVATFSTGSPEDVRYLGECIAQLADRQLEFAQAVHDAVGRPLPAAGVKLSDWLDEQTKKTT